MLMDFKDKLVIVNQDVLELAADNIANGMITYIPAIKQKLVIHVDESSAKLEDIYVKCDDLYKFNTDFTLLNETTQTIMNDWYTTGINRILKNKLGISIDSFINDYKDLLMYLKSNESIVEREAVIKAIEYLYECNREVYLTLDTGHIVINVPHDVIYTLEHTIVVSPKNSLETIEYPLKQDFYVTYTVVNFCGDEIKQII